MNRARGLLWRFLAGAVLASLGCAVPVEAEHAEVAWEALYDGPGYAISYPEDVTVDATGNLYVTGFLSLWPENLFVAAYDADGAERWTVYASPGRGYAIAVDALGNVYASGCDYSLSGQGADMITVKFAPDGTEIWRARYSGPADGDDRAAALAVDAAGYVYVAGSSAGEGSDLDITTVKYAPDGAEQWVARYNGPGNAVDYSTGILSDALGSIYVVGTSEGAGTGRDICTVKYAPDGTELWVARYDGPAGGNDTGWALSLDEDQNVLVAGTSAGESTFADYATVKYAPDGTELWVARYDGPGVSSDEAQAVVVDGIGNVIVTGESRAASESDIATVKYAPNGTELWAVRHDGAAFGDARPVGISVDEAGNVYVAGDSVMGDIRSLLTVKYAPDGVQLWTSEHAPLSREGLSARAMAADPEGNAFLLGISLAGDLNLKDSLTIKIDSEGAEVWAARKKPPLTYDQFAVSSVSGQATDGEGNVYVVGSCALDLIVATYDPAGGERWVVRYAGPSNLWDEAVAVAPGTAGYLHVAGTSAGAATDSDVITLTYDAEGSPVWMAILDGPAHGVDEAAAVAADGEGNVYVTGNSEGVGTGADVLTVKYGPDGTEQWAERFDGPVHGMDKAGALALDPGGNLLVTGFSEAEGTGTDYLTLQYDPDGNLLWSARYNGPADGEDVAAAVVTDAEGCVYVTGASASPGPAGSSHSDYATVKYGPDGTELWVARYGGLAQYDDEAVDMVVGDGGALFVTGNVSEYCLQYVHGLPVLTVCTDYATLAYDAEGHQQWVRTYDSAEGSPVGADDRASGMATDGAGNVYVTGSGGTVKYDPDGTEIWIAEAPAGMDAIALDAGGRVSLARGGDSGIRTAMLRQDPDPCNDVDGDGYGSPGVIECPFPQEDCDDADPGVNPGAAEVPGNGVDDDCDPGTPLWGTPASIMSTGDERASSMINTLASLFLPLGILVILVRPVGSVRGGWRRWGLLLSAARRGRR